MNSLFILTHFRKRKDPISLFNFRMIVTNNLTSLFAWRLLTLLVVEKKLDLIFVLYDIDFVIKRVHLPFGPGLPDFVDHRSPEVIIAHL